MGGDIVAEKFTLLKTRGSNGVAFTHIVEDTLLGQRAVIKISDWLGVLGLEYLKAGNLAREMDIPGLLMPFEGGILEEEGGYYLAFPELGEPSLENYLRMGVPLSCGEILGIVGELLRILEFMHGAGCLHLFINTRNVFYRPRVGITLKDPALKREFFQPLLELVATPDFSYFSPEVMDGAIPGVEADFYATGRLALRLLEDAVDAGASPAEHAVRYLAATCQTPGEDGVLSASVLLEELEAAKETAAERFILDPPDKGRTDIECGDTTVPPNPSWGSRPKRAGKPGGRSKASTVFVATLAFVLLLGLVLSFLFQGGDGKAPAKAGAGGHYAGGGDDFEAMFAARSKPIEEESTEASESGDGVLEVSSVEDTNGEGDLSSTPAVGKKENEEVAETPTANPASEPSPASPVAAFNVYPAQGQSPLQVSLDASSSYDPDGHIVSYAWSCGGGGVSLYRVFESNVIPASVPVTLTVTDDGGHSSSTTRYVTLY